MTESVSKADAMKPLEEGAAPVTEKSAELAPEADASEAGQEAADAPGGEEALVGLREELEALNDRHLRLAAEFTNY
ncbi:MAG: hypothetical protein FIA95_01700, partial [Gemmatimonadetes bacterium]|nr:hypothetical protein [Gemmatimonadota bacterium]